MLSRTVGTTQPSRGCVVVLLLLWALACSNDSARAQPTEGSGESSTTGSTPSTGERPVDIEAGARHAALGVIDSHSHLFGTGAWPLVQSVLDAHGIAYIVNLSGGSPHSRMRTAHQLAEESGGRVLNAMNVDWAGFPSPAFAQAVADELELLVTDFGYVGLKVSKALGLGVTDETGELIAVDDARLDPIWARAGSLGVPVFIHTGDPRAFWEPVTPENERFAELSAHPSWSYATGTYPSRDELLAQRDRVFARHPETTFVAVHFGGNPEDLAYVSVLMDRFPNVYVDLAARLPEIGRHAPEDVRALFERHPGRILFATDIAIGIGRSGDPTYVLGSSGPVPDTASDVAAFFERHWQWLETNDREMVHPTPIQGNWTIDAIGLSPEILRQVYYTNAYELIVAPALARRAARDGAP